MSVARGFPRLFEHQILDRDKLERTVGLRLVNQHRGLGEIGIGSSPCNAPGRFIRQAQKVAADVMEPHRPLLCRITEHFGGHAFVVRGVALGNGDCHVSITFGCLFDLIERWISPPVAGANKQERVAAHRKWAFPKPA